MQNISQNEVRISFEADITSVYVCMYIVYSSKFGINPAPTTSLLKLVVFYPNIVIDLVELVVNVHIPL